MRNVIEELKDCDEINERVKESWPLAFAEAVWDDNCRCFKLAKTVLSPHNEEVALLAWATPLFRRMAHALENKLPQALPATLVAASLHDIGKPARYYLNMSIEKEKTCPPKKGEPSNNREERGSLSFSCHEHVAGVLLQNAVMLLRKRGCRNRARVLWLAMQAVSRHHSAMSDRHPRTLRDSESRPCANTVGSALKTLNVADITVSLPVFLRGTWVDEALNHALHNLLPKVSQSHLALWYDYVDSVYPDLDEAWNQFSLGYSPLMRFINVATGILVVSDILVSSMENRHLRGSLEKDYAQRWKKELGIGNRLARSPEDTQRIRELVEGVPC